MGRAAQEPFAQAKGQLGLKERTMSFATSLHHSAASNSNSNSDAGTGAADVACKTLIIVVGSKGGHSVDMYIYDGECDGVMGENVDGPRKAAI